MKFKHDRPEERKNELPQWAAEKLTDQEREINELEAKLDEFVRGGEKKNIVWVDDKRHAVGGLPRDTRIVINDVLSVRWGGYATIVVEAISGHRLNIRARDRHKIDVESEYLSK
jgi:hypothetical protein